jgi:hypothetical protein
MTTCPPSSVVVAKKRPNPSCVRELAPPPGGAHPTIAELAPALDTKASERLSPWAEIAFELGAIQ